MQSPLLVVYILQPLLLANTIVGVCVAVAVAAVFVAGVAVVPNELCSCLVHIDHYCVSSAAGKLQMSEK